MNNKDFRYEGAKILTVNNLKTQEKEEKDEKEIYDKNCEYSKKIYEELYDLFISFNDLSKKVLERISILEERISILENKLLSADKI